MILLHIFGTIIRKHLKMESFTFKHCEKMEQDVKVSLSEVCRAMIQVEKCIDIS